MSKFAFDGHVSLDVRWRDGKVSPEWVHDQVRETIKNLKQSCGPTIEDSGEIIPLTLNSYSCVRFILSRLFPGMSFRMSDRPNSKPEPVPKSSLALRETKQRWQWN